MSEEKSTLIVRHLPPELTATEQEELIKHFGASLVRCMGSEGRLKHCAFAAFPSHEAARKALSRLHQLEVLGSVLTVEFSRRQFQKFHPSVIDSVKKRESEKDKEAQEEVVAKINEELEDKKKVSDRVNQIEDKWGLVYPMNPRLQYMYPPPTVTILTNIANALASSPKFYVQVLHLMNKLNLPPPFGALTLTPPLEEGDEVRMTQSSVTEPSTEESELESDEGTEQRHNVGTTAVKRLRSQSKKVNKRAKLQQIINPIVAPAKPKTNVVEPSEVFEQSQTGSRFKNIRLCLPGDGSNITSSTPQLPPPRVAAPRHETTLQSVTSLSRTSQGRIPVPPMASQMNLPSGRLTQPTMDTSHALPSDLGQIGTIPAPPEVTKLPLPAAADLLELMERQSDTAPQPGFGKIEPPVKPAEVTEEVEGEEEEWGAGEFISDRRLRKYRLSSREMKDMKVFQNYNAGEPSSRLYVKNLAKSTSEKDLHYIFGRYIDWEREDQKMMFDIRLMKEGRMKGQAFITFPTDTDTKPIVKDTNAFLLHDKPMVVVFARSAKPKDS